MQLVYPLSGPFGSEYADQNNQRDPEPGGSKETKDNGQNQQRRADQEQTNPVDNLENIPAQTEGKWKHTANQIENQSSNN